MRNSGEKPTEESAADRTDNKRYSGKMTPFNLTDPSLAGKYVTTIRGADGAWFGPLQPLQPIPPQDPEAGVVGRRFDYPTGYNLQQRPRGYEPVSFQDLRALSRNCDIMRLVIETRKDQLSSLDWTIRVKADAGQDRRKVKASPDQTNRIKQITAFMQSPDQEMDFEQWTRAFFEDSFVLDAPFVYRRMNRGGGLYALELIDGATISPLLDATGRRPLAPEPAYQQILKGVPAADYSAEQAYYPMRNPSTNKVYGYSPVEQVLITANIAVRRAMFQLEYYTKGSQPDAFLSLPAAWTMDQVATFQKWLDGLQQERRSLRAIPGDFKYQATKDAHLKDEYDDYLNRIICFAFSVSPTALVKMMNRATSQNQHEQAIEEGNGPTMRFYEKFWTKICAREFESPDLEFSFNQEMSVDPKEQQEVLSGYVKAGILSIDQALERLGEDPIGGVASDPMVLTANGYVPLGANVPVADGGDLEPTPAPVVVQPPVGAESGLGKPPKPPTQVEKLAKVHHKGFTVHAKASAPRKDIAKAKKAVAERITKLLAEVGRHSAKQVMALTKLHKAEDEDPAERARKIAEQIDLGTMTLVATGAQQEMADIAAGAGKDALAIFGLGTNNDLVNQVSVSAVDYARDRAAYLVGKRVLPDGSIIDNPDARYAIDDATRDSLQTLITDWLEEAKPMPDLADAIEADYAFSERRARLIADTEIANANSAGALAGYKASEAAGNTIFKVWSVTDDQCCDDCEDNEAEGPIPLDEPFPSGDDAPLAHPNCRCVLLSATENGDETGDEAPESGSDDTED